MSKITINGNVTGSNAHIGDKNYYASQKDFYAATPNTKYSQTEKELVDLIFLHAPTVEEREQILISLRTIKENDGSEGHEESNKENAGRIKHFIESLAAATVAKSIVELVALWIKS